MGFNIPVEFKSSVAFNSPGGFSSLVGFSSPMRFSSTVGFRSAYGRFGSAQLDYRPEEVDYKTGKDSIADLKSSKRFFYQLMIQISYNLGFQSFSLDYRLEI